MPYRASHRSKAKASLATTALTSADKLSNCNRVFGVKCKGLGDSITGLAESYLRPMEAVLTRLKMSLAN